MKPGAVAALAVGAVLLLGGGAAYFYFNKNEQ